MTTRDDVIRQYILDELLIDGGARELDDEQSLIAAGVLDSLALLKLILFVEKHFGITVENGDVVPDNFETIGRIASFVDAKDAASGASGR